MYKWSKLQNVTLPTIADVLKAVQLADQEKDDDPRPLMAVLSRLRQADLKLLGLRLNVDDDVTGFDFTVQPLKQFEKDKKVIKLALEAHDRFVESGIADYFDVMLQAEGCGVSGLITEYSREFGKWKLPAIQTIATTALTYKKGTDKSGTFFKLGEGDRPDAEEIPNERKPDGSGARDGYILCRYNPFAAENPYYVGGLDRTAMWLVMIKHFNWQDWAAFNERYGDPVMIAKYKRGAGTKEKSAAWEMLDELGKHSRALLSEDISIDVVKAMVEGSVQSFERLVEKVDTALSVLYSGATLSTDIQDKGAFSAAKVHLTKEEKRTWRRLKFVQRIVTQQFLRVDYRLNVGTTEPMPYEFMFETNESVDFEANARVLNDVIAAGYEVESDEEVSARVGFTVKRTNVSISPPAIPTPPDAEKPA